MYIFLTNDLLVFPRRKKTIFFPKLIFSFDIKRSYLTAWF